MTTKRYRAATIFVDHHSALSYLHLQKSTNAEETLEAKVAFERYAAKSGVTVKHYHADNGRFGETAFKAEVLKQGQTISFCGVNAHFQNAVAERRIRILQDQARAMILHARGRWPSAIDAHLWPYAIRMANEVYNSTPTSGDTQTPYKVFLGNISPESKWQVECGFKERLKKISNPTIRVGRPPTDAPKLEHSTPEEDLFQQSTTDPLPSDDISV